MSRSLFTILAVHAISLSLLSQNKQSEINLPKSTEAFPFIENIGFRLGGARYTGDAGELTELRGTVRPLTLGADVFCGKRLVGISEGSSTIMLGLEGSLGYRSLQGVHPDYDFSTTAIPVSLTFDASFHLAKAIHPFISSGAGVIVYSVTQNRVGAAALAHRVVSNVLQGLTAYIPLRVGIRFPVGSSLRIDASFEQSISFADNLDGLSLSRKDWRYDNYHTFSLGVSWTVNRVQPTWYSFSPTEDNTPEKPSRPTITMVLGPPPTSVLSEEVDSECNEPYGVPQKKPADRRWKALPGRQASPFMEVLRASSSLHTETLLPGLVFRPSSATLTDASRPILDSLVETMSKDNRISCEITWLEALPGTSQQNGMLPWERAMAVLEHLRAAGVPAERVHVACLGRSPSDGAETRILPADACLEIRFSREIVHNAPTATESPEEPPR